jgi:hypothetical protein
MFLTPAKTPKKLRETNRQLDDFYVFAEAVAIRVFVC